MLFVHWFDFGDLSQDNLDLQVLELFAGVARVARVARRMGLRARAYDINFDHENKRRFRFSSHSNRRRRAFMDINGEAGFVFLGSQAVKYITGEPKGGNQHKPM